MLILVTSCKSYSDAWLPFCQLFDRFWPNCANDRVILSDAPPNRIDIEAYGFSLKTINDTGWLQNLANALTTIEDETILLMQEDFFLCYPVLIDKIKSINDWLITSDFAACRVCPMPGGDGREVFQGVAEITLGADYRVSCQATIWKREALRILLARLLERNFNRIQDFEVQGSRLVDDFKLSGWVRDTGPWGWPIAYQCSAIAGGKWMAGAVNFCREQGVRISSNRPIVFGSPEEETILGPKLRDWMNQL